MRRPPPSVARSTSYAGSATTKRQRPAGRRRLSRASILVAHGLWLPKRTSRRPCARVHRGVPPRVNNLPGIDGLQPPMRSVAAQHPAPRFRFRLTGGAPVCGTTIAPNHALRERRRVALDDLGLRPYLDLQRGDRHSGEKGAVEELARWQRGFSRDRCCASPAIAVASPLVQLRLRPDLDLERRDRNAAKRCGYKEGRPVSGSATACRPCEERASQE